MIRVITVDLWQTLLVDPTHNLTNGKRHRLESVGQLLARGGCRVTFDAVLRQILATYGLLEKFAALTFSDEALVRKPHPRIFQRTLDGLGSHPSRAVHVGDDVEADVGGAKEVGMRAIHLSANGHRSDADATIRSLFELPEILGRL